MNAFNAAFAKMDDFMNSEQQVPTGQGEFYCTSTTTTTLPNGVVETHRSTRTNNRQQEEHYKQLGDKRVVEKMDKDLQSGRQDVRRDMYNIKEDEIDSFNKQFEEQTKMWNHKALGSNDLFRSDRALAGNGSQREVHGASRPKKPAHIRPPGPAVNDIDE